MAAYHRIFSRWNKYGALCARLMYLIKVFFVTYYGQILIRMLQVCIINTAVV